MNDEKIKRVKYIRALEKFALVVTASLKRADWNGEKFAALVAKNAAQLEKIEPVYLDQPYTRALCEFVNLAANGLGRDELLRAANALEKFRNARNYKKSKHKGDFYDGY